jgi:hypothetical protein
LFLLVICGQLFAQQPAKPKPSPVPDDDLIRMMRGAVEAERLLTWFIDTQMTSNDIAAIVDTDLNSNE